MATGKPGILTRLGNLIIVQVLFIFIALALILFTPSRELQQQEQLSAQQRELAAATQSLRSMIQEQMASGGGEFDRDRVDEFLTENSSVTQATVLVYGDSISVDVIYAFARNDESRRGADRDVSSFCDFGMIRQIVEKPDLGSGGTYIYGDYVGYCTPLERGSLDGTPLVIVARPHNLALSSRENLKYAILVLFLCSTLISLLTVNFLMGKFKRPLDRIIGGFSETAGGKLHQLNDLDDDPHLGRLAKAYNEMAGCLWDQRRELDAFVSRLADTNTELSESKQFLAALINLSPLAVVVADPAGRVLIFNRAAGETFGYTEEEMVGRPVQDLMAGGGEEQASKRIAGGRNTEFEVVGRRANGESFPVYIVSSHVDTADEEGAARIYVCRDITESRNFQDMMIRLDRYYTRGEMAGDIAHEINNYLAVLMGNVELLPLFLKRGDTEKIEKKLEVMKSTLDKIARFSDGLLDSPPETVRLEPTSINQVVENVLTFLKPQNKFDLVEVTTNLADDLPVVPVDPMQIQQLLVNLIYNAAEALSEIEGGRSICVTTRQSRERSQPGAEIEIRDSGPGVREDKLDLLFKTRFTTKRRGHGIGLVTCRKIIDNHEGSISYHSDNGAVFTVRLPVEALATETFVTSDDYSATPTA